MANGPPDPHVRELLPAGIKLKRVVEGIGLNSARRNFEALVFFQAVKVRQRQAVVGAELNLPSLEGCSHGRLVRDHTPDDTIEIREIFAPVVWITFSDDELAPLILDKLERSRPDRSRIGRIFKDVGSFEHVARCDIAEVAEST